MSNSFKSNINQVSSIVKYYNDIQCEIDDLNIMFKGKTEDFSVLIYSNYTVLFQGKKAHDEYLKWVKEENVEEFIDHVGSDEVGCGDYFGPIVVCATLIKKEDYGFLKEIGVKDSKQLNDNEIKRIASKIKDKIKSVTFTLSNEKYNQLYKTSNYNMNKIKAYLHNYVLYKIVNKNKFNGKIIVDQFCSEELYYNYLRDYKSNDIQTNISFTTKAENKYLAVACASIIARDTFLNEIEKISNETGYNILLGASNEVDKLAKKILDEKGLEYLSKYVKLNFKNTEKIK